MPYLQKNSSISGICTLLVSCKVKGYMKTQKDTFTVTIMTPEQVVWEGTVAALTSKNSEGSFDILPDHARFMTLIEKAPIDLIRADGSKEQLTYDTAVLFFHDNAAKIYIHQHVS